MLPENDGIADEWTVNKLTGQEMKVTITITDDADIMKERDGNNKTHMQFK